MVGKTIFSDSILQLVKELEEHHVFDEFSFDSADPNAHGIHNPETKKSYDSISIVPHREEPSSKKTLMS